MPGLEQAILERQQAEEAEAQQQASARDSEAQRKTAEQLGHYEALLGHEEWTWFIQEIAGKAITVEHDGALDVKKTATERSDHAQRHDALYRLFAGMETTRKRLRIELNKLSNP